MAKSRLIRSAVNLCVIGALLFPHAGLGLGLAKACDAPLGVADGCTGCGHCSVKEGARCGCCARKPKKTAEHQSCCHPAPAVEQDDRSSSDVWGVCMCGHGSQPAVPPSESRTDVEQLVKLSSTMAAPFIRVEETSTLGTMFAFSNRPYLSPHDSLRLLGVWQN